MALVCHPEWQGVRARTTPSWPHEWEGPRKPKATGSAPHPRFRRYTAPSWDPRQSSQPPQWETVPSSLSPGIYETIPLLSPNPLPSPASFNLQEVITPSPLFVGGHPFSFPGSLEDRSWLQMLLYFFYSYSMCLCNFCEDHSWGQGWGWNPVLIISFELES